MDNPSGLLVGLLHLSGKRGRADQPPEPPVLGQNFQRLGVLRCPAEKVHQLPRVTEVMDTQFMAELHPVKGWQVRERGDLPDPPELKRALPPMHLLGDIGVSHHSLPAEHPSKLGQPFRAGLHAVKADLAVLHDGTATGRR